MSRRPILLCCLALSLPAFAEVSSETLFFLQPDGRHYLLQRSIHSDSASHRFHLPKTVRREDLRYVNPADFQWDDSLPDSNLLSFDAGGFTLIYPGVFDDAELQRLADGSWRYRSWHGRPDRLGRYGYWYAPGDFDRYGYGWLLPDNIEILDYRANVPGRWTRRPGALGFYAEGVNNVTFEIRYRVHAPAAPAPAKAPAGDADRDGVPGDRDLCPSTPTGAKVDRVGCALDADRDGVPDGIDRCQGTPEEALPVDTAGCPAAKSAPGD